MKRLIAALLIGSTALLPAPALLAQPIAKQTTYALIVCESPNNQESFCRADTHRGVRLVREISRNRCFEGRTFGYQNDGIWISGGCRAEFEIGRGGGSSTPLPRPDHQGEVFVCESRDGRRAHCAVGTRGGVALVRQISRNECVEGQSWGYDNHGVWVDHGCRAEFELLRGTGGYPPNLPPHGGAGPGQGQYSGTITCRSEGGRQQFCPAQIGSSRVDLTRRISKAPCVLDQSWGYDRRGIWVSNGCRGEFAIVYVPQPRLILCESVGRQRAYCPANTTHGVELNRQISRSECTEGYTWGYDRDAIWVDRGCRAEFLVQ